MKKQSPPPQVDTESLQSWRALNKTLRQCDEESAKALLEQEISGKGRLQFMLRIHGTYNKRRYERERKELAEATKAA